MNTRDASADLEAAPIDADLIRQSYNTVLLATGHLPQEQRARLAGLLRGHAGLLLPEVEGQAPHMRGEWWHTAEHVVRRTHRALDVTVAESRRADRLDDLASLTRSLLMLHQQAAPPRPLTSSARS
ncbi:hypothetical protein ACQPXS_47410 (plasmid) [Streptomyces sp. CA-142005]|uniref:hypothetical protein n=1 Tax=Streptomyces sp. CA-142005 TaxID=3240052 RepID=UPI003D909C83